jgi:hydrogenase-4 component B
MGVFLSADLFTTFIFFEIMSFTSYVMVVHDEKMAAMRAGETYVAVAVIGGMVMLMGIFMVQNLLGTLNMDELRDAASALEDKTQLYIAGGLILFGFGAKAGMFPLHIWLPRAHPVAPAPASALLSGILTKAGVFGILVISSRLFFHDSAWGTLILALGVITMFLGAVLAVFSIDLKRTLACSSMSQIGFILVGVGMQGLLGHHNTLAVWGTVLHMVNHSLIKLVLFMCAGVIYMNLHQLDLNKIRGWGRNKPLLAIFFLMGVLGIIGMPFWNGYISKTLLHESIVEYMELFAEDGIRHVIFKAVEWIFLISGGLTAAYMTKLFVAIFIEKPTEPQHETNGKYMNWQSTLAIGIPAVILPLIGMVPGVFMKGMAELSQGFMFGESPEEAIKWFSFTNLKGAAISLIIGAVVYIFIIRGLLMKKDENGVKVYVNRWSEWLDLENLVYRPLIQYTIPFICAFFCRIFDSLVDWIYKLLSVSVLRKIDIPEANPEDYQPGSFIPHPKENTPNQQIASTISFSLLLFGAGFCAAFIYLIYIMITR